MIIVFSNFSGVLQTGSKVIAWSLCLARVHLQMKQCQHTKWLKKIFSTRWKKEIEWSPPPASRAFYYGTFPCNKRQSKKRWKRLCSQGGSPQNAKLLEPTHQGGYELRCDLPPKMNVHREDRKLERILVAVRKGFYARCFSVVPVLRQFFDASGCLMKQNEQKKSDWLRLRSLWKSLRSFCSRIFLTRAVQTCINVFVILNTKILMYILFIF